MQLRQNHPFHFRTDRHGNSWIRVFDIYHNTITQRMSTNTLNNANAANPLDGMERDICMKLDKTALNFRQSILYVKLTPPGHIFVARYAYIARDQTNQYREI